ncbi:MAG: methionine gamma-lyase family protein [Candidatus Eremiobacteraeota bacterium]|nr:methionine gamma-lyase family protein [Candidatus Eremiobacteraeota bacterium]
MLEQICRQFGIEPHIERAATRALELTQGLQYPAQSENRIRVLQAFIDQDIADSDLGGSVGYGYDDPTRAHYESLLAKVFGAPAALARLSLVSGTHAIVAALEALVLPGKTLLSVTGPPYDTLRNAILTAPHSLVERGMRYEEIGLRDGTFDDVAIAQQLEDPDIAAVFVQRSRGYAPRRSVGIEPCATLFDNIKNVRPDVAIVVDNCYGELVETREPTHIGADVALGSLIKNLGGGLAPAGAYAIGKADVIERISAHHYAPGLRSGVGPTLNAGRALLQGLFIASLIVEQVLRGLDFCAALFEELGYAVDPRCGAARTDTVQAIRVGNAERVQAFACGLQRAMPVNARFRPEPGPVPGYAEPVIMSSGAFISGATIELSCDAPLREPFEVYLQGGLFAEHTIAGTLLAAQALAKN